MEKYGYDGNYVRASFGESLKKCSMMKLQVVYQVDIMDYLPRDISLLVYEYGKVDYHRLISSLEVLLNGHLGIDKSAINSLESMLILDIKCLNCIFS